MTRLKRKKPRKITVFALFTGFWNKICGRRDSDLRGFLEPISPAFNNHVSGSSLYQLVPVVKVIRGAWVGEPGPTGDSTSVQRVRESSLRIRRSTAFGTLNRLSCPLALIGKIRRGFFKTHEKLWGNHPNPAFFFLEEPRILSGIGSDIRQDSNTNEGTHD